MSTWIAASVFLTATVKVNKDILTVRDLHIRWVWELWGLWGAGVVETCETAILFFTLSPLEQDCHGFEETGSKARADSFFFLECLGIIQTLHLVFC